MLTINSILSTLVLLPLLATALTPNDPTFGSSLTTSSSRTPATGSAAPPTSCPINVLACHAPGVDSCCVPKLGMIVLAQQWIPNYGPADAFTLHGLWPDTCTGGKGPRNGCDSSRDYPSVSRLLPAAMLEKMNTYWPSYKDDNDLFWVHEWTTHGTCVSTMEPRCFGSDYRPGQEVAHYFELGLTLRERFDLHAALLAANITPGGTYGVEQIVRAVKSKFGVEPVVQCGKDGNLSEIHLFFSVRGREGYEIMDALHPGGSGCRGNQVGYPVKYQGNVAEQGTSDAAPLAS